LEAKIVTLHVILLGVGGLSHTSKTLHHLEELGLDSRRSTRQPLYYILAPSIMSTNWVLIRSTMTRTLKKNRFQGLGLEHWAASHPPDPHYLSFGLVEETRGTSGQHLLYPNWCRERLATCEVHPFFCCRPFSWRLPL